jgi:integrase
MIFENAIGSYLSARNLDGGGAERDKYSLQHLKGHFSGRSISDLRRADVRGYIESRQAAGVKLATVQRELRLFSAAINFCNAEFDIRMPNPVSCLSLTKGEKRVRWITRVEAERLMLEAEHSSACPHLPVFIRLALNTGCRRGELLNLEWGRVDTEHRKILLEARHTKARRRRAVPLNDDALRALARLRAWQASVGVHSSLVFAGENGKIRSLRRSWRMSLQRAEIEDFRIHDLRHTFASWLVMQGVSIYVVRDLLGHASVTQTEIYAHLAPDQGAAAVQRLSAF